MRPIDGGSLSSSRASTRTVRSPAAVTAVGSGADGRGFEVRPARGHARALVALARPRQWIKNALVIAAPGAAGALAHDDVPARVVVACFAFCMISAGIYALNDVRDRDEDRRHPRKCLRPVAAGEIEPREAVVFAVGWLLGGLALCAAVTPLLALVGLTYLALTLTYTWIWRHVPVLDLIALAGGFVLRAVAGGVAAPVELSRWFVLVVTCAAVFVAAGKRMAELVRTSETGRRARRVVERYTARGLTIALAISGAGALFAYCVWAFELPDVDGVPWRLLTVIPFAISLLRYGSLVRVGAGEAPEEVVMSDRLLMAAGAAWLMLFALSVNAAG